MVASAAVMNQRPDSMARLVATEQWQNDAWEFFDEVGELRFAIGWVANGLSRVNLSAATRPDQLGDEPTALRQADGAPDLSTAEQLAVDLVGGIAGGPDGQSQMLSRLATLLSVPGVGWVLVENRPDDGPRSPVPPTPEEIIDRETRRPAEIPAPDATWKWTVLSNEEVREAGDEIEVRDPEAEGAWRTLDADHVLVKVWRSHPRRADIADSPCRPSRRVLRRIMLLDDHIDATAQSRLAGAGLLVLPSEVEFKPMLTNTDPADPGQVEPVEDDFADVLVDTMTVPIGDRGSAAAVVPLTVKIPGEYVDKVRHITFWSEFSEVVDGLQNRAIKRLALGMDMPPEIVTGVSGMNHWGAWQVEEQAVSLHIEPLAEIICHALTIGYLRPALEASGIAAEDAARLMVFYDTTDLTTRPDRSDDAIAAYDRLELSGAALRRESGLAESDAPDDDERHDRLVLRTLDRAPTLAEQLLPELGVKVDPLPPDPATAPLRPTTTTPDRPTVGQPEDRDRTGPPAEPAEQIAAAYIEACDGLVHRALERAGGRLRRSAGRGVQGGAATVQCDDPTVLHTLLDASTFATLEELTTDVWKGRTPDVAARYEIAPALLEGALDRYVSDLLTSGQPHRRDSMAARLPRPRVASLT